MAEHSSPRITFQQLFPFGFALLLSVAGMLVYLLPGGFDLEESVALDFLFHQRQTAAPPESVILVSIDKISAQSLGVANASKYWPRALHARLIDRLADAGAAVIVFDIFFQQAREDGQDAALIKAVQKAGNVVLFARLHRQVEKIADGSRYSLEQLTLPMPALQQAAAASAPFVLPKVPIMVSQFWTFYTAGGGLATLPTVTLELFAVEDHKALLAILAEVAPQQALGLQQALKGLSKTARTQRVRRFFKRQISITQQVTEALQEHPNKAVSQHLQALLALYLGPERRYLNFYGPPRTITTRSYHEVLAATEAEMAQFKGKVVFVGLSEEHQPEQKDNFYTVFSQTNGLDLSGVEIAATAFANLLSQNSLRLPTPLHYFIIITGYGLLLAWSSTLTYTSLFIGLSLICAALYTLVVLYLFSSIALWLPLFVPVLLQTPLALFFGLLWRHRQLRHERNRIHRAFGYYLPESVVDKLARNAQQQKVPSEKMFGVCMASDAAQYTQLAELMSPEELNSYMNDYYERLFKPVRAHGGTISDVVGDSMLAIWSAPQEESHLRRQACFAAIETLQIEQDPLLNHSLNTRIGLHAGEIMLGSIGALDHFEYRAVGDIVNTASRIETLNKQLGTSLLVSEAVLTGLDGFVSRKLGAFRMVGKQQAITVYELLGLEGESEQLQQHLCDCFAKGLHAYQSLDLANATLYFQQTLELSPHDGPSLYYLQRSKSHMQGELPLPKDGVIVLQKKNSL